MECHLESGSMSVSNAVVFLSLVCLDITGLMLSGPQPCGVVASIAKRAASIAMLAKQ